MKTTPGERFDRSSIGSAYKPESRMHDPRDIKIDPNWNGRIMSSPETVAHIATLEASILKDGVREAIKVKYDVKTGVRTVVAGQCRLTAVLNLWGRGHKIQIPCERVEGDEVELTLENLTSNAGLPLTQWEAGAEYRKLLRWGQNIDDIAARCCKPKRYVTEAIALSNTSVEAKALLASGSVTPGAVLHATKEHGDAAATVLKERIAARPQPPPKPQAQLPGVPAKREKPIPVARPKKPSAAEKLVKSASECLALADKLAHVALDNDGSWKKVTDAAKAYQAARGI